MDDTVGKASNPNANSTDAEPKRDPLGRPGVHGGPAFLQLLGDISERGAGALPKRGKDSSLLRWRGPVGFYVQSFDSMVGRVVRLNVRSAGTPEQTLPFPFLIGLWTRRRRICGEFSTCQLDPQF